MTAVEGAGQPAPSAIDLALAWAGAGFRCFPVGSDKRPVLDHWNEVASRDPAVLRQMFVHSPLPGHEWRCALIPGSAGYIVYDCDVKEGRLGPQLADDLGIPDDFTVVTPSGGQHRYCRKREDRHISNLSPWAREGIDVRCDSGYVLAPGTPGYVIAIGTLMDAQEAPEPVWKPLRSPPPGMPGMSAATEFREVHETTRKTVNWLLARFPGAKVDGIEGGVVHLTRPGKASGTSLTVGWLDGEDNTRYHGAVWNYSSTWDVRMGEGPYSERFLYLRQGRLMSEDEARTHDAEAMVENGQPERSSWHMTERTLENVLSGRDAPAPTILHRADGPALLYPARLNVIFGKSEGGKTWLTIEAMRQVVMGGGTAAYADYEDSDFYFANRLRMIGWDATEAWKARRLNYWAPDDELRPRDLDGIDLLVIDSASHFLSSWGPVEGGSSNSNDHVARVYARLCRLAETTETSIVMIDHGAKGDDKSTIGASSKRNVVNGAEVRVVNQERFSQHRAGYSNIYVTKDRNGGIQTEDVAHDPNGGRPWGSLTFDLDMNDTYGLGTKLEVVEFKPEKRAERKTKAMEHEASIISVLVKAPAHRMKSENLRAHAGLSRSTYGDAIIRLLDRGIVTKEGDDEDGRVAWIVLTDPNELDLMPPDWTNE